MDIQKDDCRVISDGDGSWTLISSDGVREVHLPAGFAANEAAAKPLLMIMADTYNRGYRHGRDDGRSGLQHEVQKLLNIPSTDMLEEAI